MNGRDELGNIVAWYCNGFYFNGLVANPMNAVSAIAMMRIDFDSGVELSSSAGGAMSAAGFGAGGAQQAESCCFPGRAMGDVTDSP